MPAASAFVALGPADGRTLRARFPLCKRKVRRPPWTGASARHTQCTCRWPASAPRAWCAAPTGSRAPNITRRLSVGVWVGARVCARVRACARLRVCVCGPRCAIVPSRTTGTTAKSTPTTRACGQTSTAKVSTRPVTVASVPARLGPALRALPAGPRSCTCPNTSVHSQTRTLLAPVLLSTFDSLPPRMWWQAKRSWTN